MTSLPTPPEGRAPRKALGQHFLTHERDVHRILEALDPAPDDPVLEIGPGPGALTRLLVRRCRRVRLLEKDPRFVEDLRQRYRDHPGVEVLEGDATKPTLGEWLVDGTRVVGNLPYNVGTAILLNLLSFRARLRRVVVMLQREVADRLVAGPGDRSRGALSLRVQARAQVTGLFAVSPDHFFPRPAVWSAVVRLDPDRADPRAVAAAQRPGFDALAQALFAQPRKTVANSLTVGSRLPRERVLSALERASIDPSVRPAEVSMESFVTLCEILLEP